MNKDNKKQDDNFQTDLSFEEAMRKIANTPKEDVEKAIKEAEERENQERDEETPEE